MSSQTAQIIPTDRRQKVGQKIAKTIIRMYPGLGPKTQALADVLADSGLSMAESTALLLAAYSGPSNSGQGQGPRMKHFVNALKVRYGDRLERAANNVTLFKALVGELESIVDTRDELRDSGIKLSFLEALRFDALGISGDEISRLMEEQTCFGPVAKKMRLLKALDLVEKGQFATVEAALYQADSAYFGHEYE